MKAVALLLLATAALHAQARSPQLPAQLGAAARADVGRLVDSAQAAGLPVDPILAKVAEGVLKGADDERIVRAARSLVRHLGAAREVMPRGASNATLTATASALQAGVSRAAVERLVAMAREATEGELAVALVTLTDLAATGVPTEPAADAVGSLLERRAHARQYTALRTAIARDVQVGTPPLEALAARVPEVQQSSTDRTGPPRAAGAPRSPDPGTVRHP